jgi:hypothetical protein
MATYDFFTELTDATLVDFCLSTPKPVVLTTLYLTEDQQAYLLKQTGRTTELKDFGKVATARLDDTPITTWRANVCHVLTK